MAVTFLTNEDREELEQMIAEVGENRPSSGQNVDYSVLGLGYGADGKLYILVNGIPTGSGVIVAAPVVDDIRLTDIVSYYQEPTQAVADELNALGDEYVSFIAVADTHVESNSLNSQNIIRYLLKNTKANRLFHLGDIASEWSEEAFWMYFEPFKNCTPQVFFAFGNHDWIHAEPEDVALIYDTLLADKYYLRGNPEKFYYYFDDTERKIRYLVINNSPNQGSNSISSEELAWIVESVQMPTSDWKLIAFGHYDIMPNDPITDAWNSQNAEEITNALKATNGVLVGYFCGHEHHDRIVVVEDSFYQVTLLNDKCHKDNTYAEIINPTRTAGTVSEQAVSVVSINTLTGDVTIRRIGAGENMNYNYLDLDGTPDIPDEPDIPDVPETGVSNETTWTDGVAYTYDKISGYYIDDKNGDVVQYASYNMTPYLYCEGASKLRVQMKETFTTIKANARYNAFYDADKQFIKNIDYTAIDASAEGNYLDIDIPDNASYFVMSHKNDYLDYVDFIPLA